MTFGANSPSSRDPKDIRPVVARLRGQAPAWLLVGVVVLGGVVLFSVLDGQRRAASAPTAQIRAVDRVYMPPALPPLYLPPEPPPPPPRPDALVATSPLPPPPSPFPTMPVPAQPPIWNYTQPGFEAAPAAPQPVMSSGAALVIDTTSAPETGGLEGGAPEEQRPVRTTRLRRQATTVPQGTLIPAVLETALDSTRPGHVRAIVSRDVTGFDGSRVLIPRGTRLFGEYQSDVAPGQNRALVQWTRLVRPDGVSIAIASPAADMQGRAGVQGRVDHHFLERFGAAILQTTLNIGGALATRNIGGDGPVIVNAATPALASGATPPTRGQSTLRVDAGSRVAVLVARDLEFSSGEAR